MKAWGILASALVAFSSTAFAAPDDAPPKVELPLGPYVRPGRPLDVRVIGGADRVRAPGTPWALPQGDRGDEFILQMPAAVSDIVSFEIDRGGRVERMSVRAEVLPADVNVVGLFDGDSLWPQWTHVVRTVRLPSQMPRTGLPTVPEGWMLLDGPKDQNNVFGQWWYGDMAPAMRGFRQPVLLPPGSAAFEATADAVQRAPCLPSGVAAALALCAGLECALVLLLAFRRDRTFVRFAWLATAPIAALAFVLTGDRLPGALRADAVAVFIPGSEAATTVVFVRVAARRDGRATFDLPAAASSAAVLRYSSDDATVESLSAGRRVEMDVPAGQTRLFGFSVSGISPEYHPGPARRLPGDPRPEGAAIPPRLRAWIDGAGWRADEVGLPEFPPECLPTARGTVVVPAFHARAYDESPPWK